MSRFTHYRCFSWSDVKEIQSIHIFCFITFSLFPIKSIYAQSKDLPASSAQGSQSHELPINHNDHDLKSAKTQSTRSKDLLQDPKQKQSIQTDLSNTTKAQPPFFSIEKLRASINAWIDGIHGITLNYSFATSIISASADQGLYTKGLVAEGKADSTSFSLSLYRNPQTGWAWDTTGDLSYLSSKIQDFDQTKRSQPTREQDRFIKVVCQTFSVDGEPIGSFQDCNLSTRYQLNLISASYGLWGGYYWMFHLHSLLRGYLKFGLNWHPLNLRWIRASMGGYSISDHFAWSWTGILKGGILAYFFVAERVGIGLSMDLEWTPSVPFQDQLEFRGSQKCDSQSCQRERVFVDHLSILSPSFGFHLIWKWSS